MIGKYFAHGVFIALIIIAVLVALSLSTPDIGNFYNKFFAQKSGSFIIEYAENGYQPEILTIFQGDVVTFENHSNEAFWPASSVHPNHTIYPEFDPRQPIESAGSWSFQFDKVGKWNFHDHSNPLRKGIVVVEGPNIAKRAPTFQTAFSKAGGLTDCSLEDDITTEQQCWEEYIIYTLEEQGIKEAFEVLADVYDSGPSITGSCHGYAHIIGEFAYALFSADKEIELSPHTSYCGYGFYHGFIETLLLTSGDMDQARAFCEYVNSQKFAQAQAASTACYHGVGHGVVDGGDPRDWGDPEAMLAPGFAMCELMAETEFQYYLCVTGMFNAIEIIAGLDPKYQLGIIHEDPFYLCRKQPSGKIREACYTNMVPAIMALEKGDWRKIAEYLDVNIEEKDELSIDNYTVYEMPIMSVAHEFIREHLNEDDYINQGVRWCRSLPEYGRLVCFEGLSGGHMKYGSPENGYVKAVAFCESDLLRDDERESCFSHILKRLLVWYSEDKARTICSDVEEKYRKKFCQYLYL